MSVQNEIKAISDASLEKVSGGAAGTKFVSSFYCEKCGKTIRLNGVYTLEKAQKMHDEKEHDLQSLKKR